MTASAARLSVMILGLLAAPLAAQAPALPPQISAASSLEVSNTVHCAYDQMSTEDREMALLLFEREVGSSNRSHAGSPNLKVIDRLVDEAKRKCAAPYAWPSGRSEAAVAYAMNELMSESTAQALSAKGHAATPVESYFAQHRSELAGLSDITGEKSEQFRAYLLTQGWDKGETAVMSVAEFYLESLLARDAETRRFAAATSEPAASARPKAPLKAPSRARTARRGKH